MRVDYRKNKNTVSAQWTGAPSIQIDYLWRKHYRFEVGTGGEWSTEKLTDSSQDTTAYFIYVGYRADF